MLSPTFWQARHALLDQFEPVHPATNTGRVSKNISDFKLDSQNDPSYM
jgi:hypothetical protein